MKSTRKIEIAEQKHRWKGPYLPEALLYQKLELRCILCVVRLVRSLTLNGIVAVNTAGLRCFDA